MSKTMRHEKTYKTKKPYWQELFDEYYEPKKAAKELH